MFLYHTLLQWVTAVVMAWAQVRLKDVMKCRENECEASSKQVSFTLSVIKTSQLFISWIIKTGKSGKKYLEWSRRALFIKLSSKSKRTQAVTSFWFFFPPQSSQSGLGWWIHRAKWTLRRITLYFFFGFGFGFDLDFLSYLLKIKKWAQC